MTELTPEKIDTLADEQLSVEIIKVVYNARKIPKFGWVHRDYKPHSKKNPGGSGPFHPSAGDDTGHVLLGLYDFHHEPWCWWVADALKDAHGQRLTITDTGEEYLAMFSPAGQFALGRTRAEAICRAALKTVLSTKKSKTKKEPALACAD